jgi:hypothetical protein
VSGAEAATKERWTLGVRVIAGQIDRATWRNTLTYRFHPRLTAGIEYNPLADKVSPLANVLAISETTKRPALIVGTSSDRIGTPSGQSFYATLSKSLHRETGLPIAPYAGVAYGTYEHRWRPIGGLNIHFPKRFSSTVIFDGVHVHPLLNYTIGRHAFSFLMVRGRDPGASYSISF